VPVVASWPDLPPYEAWHETCDTLHALTQVLGKLCVALAPPEPQLQHAALRLTARGWETGLLPAPDGTGAFVCVLDLRRHELVVDRTTPGRDFSLPLARGWPVGEVTRALLSSLESLGGVQIATNPQEVPWTVALDEDTEHVRYIPAEVERYFEAATRAALVLAEFRAPYRGRSTPVNAWWGSFDLAVNLFSGQPADPPSQDFIMRNAMDAQEVAVGWWPGDARYGRPAFYAYAHPAVDGLSEIPLSTGGWNAELGEFVLDCADIAGRADAQAVALRFMREVFTHSCGLCEWDPTLVATAHGDPPPIS
jgi:hypothetical protein